METVDRVIIAANSFYTKLRNDPNARFRSWEHCYKCFHDARNNSSVDYDYMSLQLAFYLASWGMYRGSSFLLQKDYKIHTTVIEELLKSKYNCLFGLECRKLNNKETQDKLMDLESFLKVYYNKLRKNEKTAEIKTELSSTLITKILMGSLGCVPAYDRYFINGVKELNVTTGNYNMQSLLKLVQFYEENNEKLENTRENLKVYDLPYPQMKLLDMAFWEIGFEKDKRNHKYRSPFYKSQKDE